MRSIKRRRTIVISAILLAAAILLAVPVHWWLRARGLDAAFAVLHDGDTRQRVIEYMGEPDIVSGCSKAPAEDPNCYQKLWYSCFLARWEFAFDQNGTLLYKNYNISY